MIFLKTMLVGLHLYTLLKIYQNILTAQKYTLKEMSLIIQDHKINNCLGQILLAKKMGKTRIIAETGAGQHGVATATVCALWSSLLYLYGIKRY